MNTCTLQITQKAPFIVWDYWKIQVTGNTAYILIASPSPNLAPELVQLSWLIGDVSLFICLMNASVVKEGQINNSFADASDKSSYETFAELAE